ncbi:MAG: FtsH protease activity modulator HflK [Pseudomonadota bacterium]
MPWSNQNGGGWKSGGGGPWGQGPQGGPGQQPDLEELLKRSQDKLKQAMPGGGGSGFIWVIIALVLGGFWIYQSVYQVDTEEQAVVLRFGELNRTEGPGLHIIPWPLETVEKLKVQVENQLSNDRALSGNEASLMLAGDQNLVDIRYTVLWKISDPQQYLFKVREPERLVSVVAESVMRDVVGRTPAEQIRTSGREAAQEEAQELIQKTLDTYNAGILIRAVRMEKADPPPRVVDAFEEVQRAEQNQNKFIREAERFRNKRLGQARGEAAKILEDAKAYKAKVTTEAEGEAKRFISVYEEYSKAKDVTRKRLFLETLENVLSRSNKVIIEQGSGGSGVVPYLPLPEIAKGNARRRGGQ